MKSAKKTRAITDIRDCTGCASCMNVCPVSAISMQENMIGHIFPQIDSVSCISCGLCERICPNNKVVIGNEPITAYAAWARDESEHITSTSGGVASVVSRYVIEHGGIVYGCTCNPGGIINHERINTFADLDKLKGSKYVQSSINFAYKLAKTDLDNDLIVLFTGMPCQIAGLKNYLGKDYVNLYTMDLVCHGVPPQKLLFEHLDSQGVKREYIDNIKFREQTGCYLSVQSSNNIIYQKSDLQDLYYSGFHDCLLTRDSCTRCHYAQKKRIGNITVGDFHELGSEKPFKYDCGGNVSLLLVNDVKGERIISLCKKKLNLIEREYKEAENGNPQLCHPALRRADYNKFVKLYDRFGFKKAAKKVLRVRRIKNVLLRIRNVLKVN